MRKDSQSPHPKQRYYRELIARTLSVFLCICLSTCLSMCLSVCLSSYLSKSIDWNLCSYSVNQLCFIVPYRPLLKVEAPWYFLKILLNDVPKAIKFVVNFEGTNASNAEGMNTHIRSDMLVELTDWCGPCFLVSRWAYCNFF